jgi:hypothetical protein
LALSPNGDRALVSTHAPKGTVNQDLWLFDLARSAAPQRMTFPLSEAVSSFIRHSATRQGSAKAGNSIRLSEGGGFAPRWRADSHELFYLKPDGAVMLIEIDAAHQILASAAKRLFACDPGVGGDARWLAFAFCRSRRAAAAVQHRAGLATHRSPVVSYLCPTFAC